MTIECDIAGPPYMTTPDTSVASPWDSLCMKSLRSERHEDHYVTQLFLQFHPGRARWPRRLAQLILRAAYEKHEGQLLTSQGDLSESVAGSQ